MINRGTEGLTWGLPGFLPSQQGPMWKGGRNGGLSDGWGSLHPGGKQRQKQKGHSRCPGTGLGTGPAQALREAALENPEQRVGGGQLSQGRPEKLLIRGPANMKALSGGGSGMFWIQPAASSGKDSVSQQEPGPVPWEYSRTRRECLGTWKARGCTHVQQEGTKRSLAGAGGGGAGAQCHRRLGSASEVWLPVTPVPGAGTMEALLVQEKAKGLGSAGPQLSSLSVQPDHRRGFLGTCSVLRWRPGLRLGAVQVRGERGSIAQRGAAHAGQGQSWPGERRRQVAHSRRRRLC